ncbi:hypothetical protein CYMTET_53009, partial [Cymbomonas tetramitiformis]
MDMKADDYTCPSPAAEEGAGARIARRANSRKNYIVAKQLDVNRDSVLTAEELEVARRFSTDDDAKARALQRLLHFDKDQDGAISAEEYKEFQDAEDSRNRLHLLEYIQECFKEILHRKENYINMFCFIAFVAFYFGILFLQRKAFIAYDITFALSQTVLPLTATGEYAKSFTSATEVYSWL